MQLGEWLPTGWTAVNTFVCCSSGPILQALQCVEGVRAVFGFCDDWEVSLVGIRTVRRIRALVESFERASGQVVHRDKSRWFACRRLTTAGRRALRNAWPEASIENKVVVLGTLLGHGVTIIDFIKAPVNKIFDRIRLYRVVRMSLAMRIMTFHISCEWCCCHMISCV